MPLFDATMRSSQLTEPASLLATFHGFAFGILSRYPIWLVPDELGVSCNWQKYDDRVMLLDFQVKLNLELSVEGIDRDGQEREKNFRYRRRAEKRKMRFEEVQKQKYTPLDSNQ